MLNKILKKSADFIHPPVIQFGPIRSGSTLVYNILKDAYPEKKIVKKHSINRLDVKRSKVIVTYRNPLDCLTSSFKRYKSLPDDDSIKKQIQELKEFGLDDLKNIFQEKGILKLKYEDFYDNYDYVFDHLEDFFKIKISVDQRENIKSKYNIEAVIKKTQDYSNFSQFDKETNLHGNHVSNTKGKPGRYEEFFTKDQLEYIKNDLSEYLNTFGY